MKSFWKNVLRMALKNKSNIIGGTLIIALGIFFFIAMFSAVINDTKANIAFIEKANLSDAYASVVSIPESEAKELENLEGIKKVTGYFCNDLRLVSEKSNSFVSVFAIGFDPENTHDTFILTPEADTVADSEIYLGYKYNQYYNPQIGDDIQISKDGEIFHFTYAGLCQSPIFMDVVPSGSTMPDGSIYDVALMSKSVLEKLTGVSKTYSYLGFELEEGYSLEDVQNMLMTQLAPFGIREFSSREKQQSIDSINNALKVVKLSGLFFPMIFLLVSVFMLYVVMSKNVNNDQTLIGTMKAFGMTDAELMSAYLVEGGLIGFFGALLGSCLGPSLGETLFDITNAFYGLGGHFKLPVSVIVVGFLISIITGVIASYISVSVILKISPAQAMKSPEPKNGLNIRFPEAIESNGPVARIGLRNITRNPVNGFMIIIATVISISVASGLMMNDDGIRQSSYNHFHLANNCDLKIALDTYDSPENVVESLQSFDSIESAEAYTTLPVMLSFKNKTNFSSATFIGDNNRLFSIVDKDEKKYEVHPGETILSKALADSLTAVPGDVIYFKIPEIADRYVPLKLVAVVDETMGKTAYVHFDSMPNYFSCPIFATVGAVKVKDGMKNEIIADLLNASNIISVNDNAREEFLFFDDMAEIMACDKIMSVFAIIAGGVMIFSISMISIRERITELGTIEILGFREGLIGYMIVTEHIVYFIIGFIISLLGSRLSLKMMTQMLTFGYFSPIQKFNLPVFLAVSAFDFTVVIIACIAQYREVKKIKFIDILKERN